MSSHCHFFVRIAEGAEDADDAEGTLVTPIFHFTRKPIRVTKPSFSVFSVFSVLSAIQMVIFVRIAEGAEDADDAEGVLVSSILDFTSKPVYRTKSLFFRVLCVLCALRDSDRIVRDSNALPKIRL